MLNSKTKQSRLPSSLPRHIGAIVLLLSIPGVLVASNWQWMRDAAVRSFNEQDWALLENTIDQMLNQGTDGDSQKWQNPETGNAGNVQVLSTTNTDTGICRDLLITNTTKANAGGNRFTYCQQPDAQWKIDTNPKKGEQK